MFLRNKKLNLKSTVSKNEAYSNADYVIVATPTNYNIDTGSFDTSTVEQSISDCKKINSQATIIIKSTVPLGFTQEMRKKFKSEDIMFSPEFLRETKALYDNLYPSRIVIGSKSKTAKTFARCC